MSLKERVYQLFFVRPEQVSGSGYAATSAVDLSYKPVGGIICMGANLESAGQTRQMLSEMQQSAMQNGVGVFFAVDEEGGRVARCASKLGTTVFDNMAVYGERNDADEAFNIGRTIGADIKSLGFNVDFAPVADVDISPTNELGNRIFGSDPYVVANMVSNVVRGLNSSGVAATLKHFPGLGAEDGNSHTASEIIIDRTLDQLRSEEFVPFKSGIQAGADFVMVGHQQVTSFGDGLPADLSYKAVTEILRGELGFNGIAITDAQEMNTISNLYYSRTAAVMAVNAGIDMILMPEDFDDAVNGVYNAALSGVISEERLNESVTRILTVKQRMGLLP
ncbi:MAG: glycoside hydrolase family 3 protein [Lachnospiraceae bacterium]|nr:glycoside hydrolase family 3 protein [Ruminococcus sp.]MCM1273997.1 glycoside hydrolase family 3 protein [Lachnospiraceae bacterium]